MAIKYMHYAEGNEAICGVCFYGDAKRILSTDNVLGVTCPVCLEMDNGAIGRQIQEEQRRLAHIARRAGERAAHLALKAWVAKGISGQEARAMARLHTWRQLEDDAGD